MKKTRLAFACLAASLVVSLSSCGFLFGPLPSNAASQPTVQHVPYSGSFKYTVDPGSAPHDVYFVFTNPDVTSDAAAKPTVNSAAITIDGKSLPSPAPQPLYGRSSAPVSLMDRIAEYNRDPFGPLARSMSSNQIQPSIALNRPAELDAVNQADTFTNVEQVNNTTGQPTIVSSLPATCRLVESAVNLGDGRTRSLSIWADTANWGLDTDPNHLSPFKVQALADHFLKKPASPLDIYHWDTAAVGEPWGLHSNQHYIQWDPNSTITILLCNLNTVYNSPNGVVVGYFWSKDNKTTTEDSGSNQRIMFYIDATLFCSYITGESTSTWQPTNYWPEFVYSTLAHEFQHMIQFYQKQILQNVGGTDTWINEMCSMIMEDLVADKLQVNGPRGVSDVAYADGSPGPSGNTDGRIPSFNQYSYYPLAQPGAFDLADYSTSYAFGAWLARNYGGADLLKRIVQCPETDDTAVINAVAAASGRKDETMQRLLEKWASAVLLSDTTAGVPAGYVYNTGGWMTSTSGGITYNLGSIDIFNYSPTLKVFTNTGSLAPGVTFTHSSNVYYEAAQALKAPQTWSLTVPPGIVMSVVLK